MEDFHDTDPLVNEVAASLRAGGLGLGSSTRAARAIFALITFRERTVVRCLDPVGHDHRCACKWSEGHATIGEAAPYLKPCAGHAVYGDWRARQERERIRTLVRQALISGESGAIVDMIDALKP